MSKVTAVSRSRSTLPGAPLTLPPTELLSLDTHWAHRYWWRIQKCRPGISRSRNRCETRTAPEMDDILDCLFFRSILSPSRSISKIARHAREIRLSRNHTFKHPRGITPLKTVRFNTRNVHVDWHRQQSGSEFSIWEGLLMRWLNNLELNDYNYAQVPAI